MNKEFIVNRQGKEFVLYAGLLDQAHREGLKRISTTLIQAPTPANGDLAICSAEVETDKGIFSGIGDASPLNVGRMIAMHCVRMAETRAKARALRDAINVGVTAIEELGDLDDDGEQPREPRGPRRDAAPKPSRAERTVQSDARAGTNAAITAGGPATAEQKERIKKLAGVLGVEPIIEADLSAGIAADRIAEMVKAVNAGQGQTRSAATAPTSSGAATQAQINRLQKLQAALGQKPLNAADLTSDAAAAKIADLVTRFNAQARGITSASEPAGTPSPADSAAIALALAQGLLLEISSRIFNLGRTDIEMPADDIPFTAVLNLIDARIEMGVALVDHGSTARRGKPKSDGPVASTLTAYRVDGVELATPSALSERSAAWLLGALRKVYDAHVAEQLAAKNEPVRGAVRGAKP